jgi:hypothetical protein
MPLTAAQFDSRLVDVDNKLCTTTQPRGQYVGPYITFQGG